MNSESSLLTKIIVLFSVFTLVSAPMANAEPFIAAEILPPASARLVIDPALIKLIGIGSEQDPVWCYSQDANAILISAPQRHREKCELKASQEKEKMKATHALELNTLKIELDSLVKKHEEILFVKEKEIQDLTEAALKRPNDYSLWWATGGFTAGVLTVLGIVWASK